MTINGKELSHWGCCLESADPLMLSHPMKELITNDNAIRHGVQVSNQYFFYDKKEMTLVFNFYRGTDIYMRIDKFIEDIFGHGNTILWRHKSIVAYYLSSQSFTSLKGIGKLAVRFLVADPFESEMTYDFSFDFNKDFKIYINE